MELLRIYEGYSFLNSTNSTIFKKYTTEQYPQIVFSNEIKRLYDSIVKGTSDSVGIVKKLYYWINDHIMYLNQ
jgi:hypothetical protein